MRFESAFGTVFTRTRASENSTLQSFFPRNQTLSSLKSPLAKSRQQTIHIFLQFSTPLNQVNHCLNGSNDKRKTYVQILNLDKSCSLFKQNLQPLCQQNACDNIYASPTLSLRFRYLSCVENNQKTSKLQYGQ